MRRLLTVAGLLVVLSGVSAVSAAPTYAALPGTNLIAVGEVHRSIGKPLDSPPQGACPYEYLCIWKDVQYSGTRDAYYYCGFYDLVQNFWPGSMWGEINGISSLDNNQTPGTVSEFWDDRFGYGNWFTETAYGYRDNLLYDHDNLPSDQNWNDRIGRILVC
jgi:hypothetical protein